jgi:hypothetical protein
MKFQLKKTYYPFPVYEFNLPSGWTCPFAVACLVKVDPYDGKMEMLGTQFRCYASASERFPSVRDARWQNFHDIKNGVSIRLPEGCTHIRIHGSGDFFSQAYFDQWLEVCHQNPNVLFWAFTKSLPFWLNRLGKIPSNLILTASKGGMYDDLIPQYGLRYAQVFASPKDVPAWMEVDRDDCLAMKNGDSFALLDNFKNKKKGSTP